MARAKTSTRKKKAAKKSRSNRLKPRGLPRGGPINITIRQIDYDDDEDYVFVDGKDDDGVDVYVWCYTSIYTRRFAVGRTIHDAYWGLISTTIGGTDYVDLVGWSSVS